MKITDNRKPIEEKITELETGEIFTTEETQNKEFFMIINLASSIGEVKCVDMRNGRVSSFPATQKVKKVTAELVIE